MQIDKKYLTGSNLITAEIMADSIYNGSRLTTFVVKFPRIVLAEMNTHKMISKNSASSRAVPFKRMLEMVKTTPFIPIAFQKDHSGMQGSEYLEGELLKDCVIKWLLARDKAVESAEMLANIGITKQICNRVLEPFLYHVAIMTGTDFQNFTALRAHDAAEIHIADAAYKMIEALNKSIPIELQLGEYHLPFSGFKEGLTTEEKIKVSVSRCARVSFFNYEGKDDYEADFNLYDRLAKMGHWSPFEHVATPSIKKGLNGNLHPNWTQHRKTFEFENKTDPRVISQLVTL